MNEVKEMTDQQKCDVRLLQHMFPNMNADFEKLQTECYGKHNNIIWTKNVPLKLVYSNEDIVHYRKKLKIMKSEPKLKRHVFLNNVNNNNVCCYSGYLNEDNPSVLGFYRHIDNRDFYFTYAVNRNGKPRITSITITEFNSNNLLAYDVCILQGGLQYCIEEFLYKNDGSLSKMKFRRYSKDGTFQSQEIRDFIYDQNGEIKDITYSK